VVVVASLWRGIKAYTFPLRQPEVCVFTL